MKSPRRPGLKLAGFPAANERKLAAFTLVELLVVIGIIALLISILLPSLNRARAAAREVQCLSNMRQLGLSIFSYANAHKQTLPLISPDWFIVPYVNTAPQWGTLLLEGKFLTTDEMFYCPDNTIPAYNHPVLNDQEYSTYWGYFSYGMNLACSYDWAANRYRANKLTDVRSSGEKILLVESAYEEAQPEVGYSFVYPWYSSNQGTAWPRHGKREKASVLWFDGHASPVRSDTPGIHSGIYGPGALTQMDTSQPAESNRWRIR